MTEQKKTQAKQQSVSKIKVTAVQPFRRAGRLWSGVTELCVDQLTEQQLKQLRCEPRLVVEDFQAALGDDSDNNQAQ